MECQNLMQRIVEAANVWPERPAQRFWNGQEWQRRSYRELVDTVQDMARGLRLRGVQAGDRVGLISSTRQEWVLADLAILTLDAVTVPIYPSVPPDQVAYIVEDAGIRLVIAENDRQASKIPPGTEILTIDPSSTGVASLGSLQESLGAVAVATAQRHDLVTLVYTSGTTGLPKGVRLTHGNILANIEDIDHALQDVSGASVTEQDVVLSFLPLSHILERMTHFFFLGRGVEVAYARSTDLLTEDMPTVKPTIMVSVPRVFEKIYGQVWKRVKSQSPIRQQVFQMAVELGRRRYQQLASGRPISSWMDKLNHLFDGLAFRPIRAAVGGRLRLVISGGAPLASEIGQFFFVVGVPVLEGYGLTETSPVLAVNVPPVPRYGTVGKPLPRVEIAIAEDGEILARGPNISPGYWNRPDETAQAFQDGWFHTGDVGRLTEDGYLRVTDRKKYLLVLSTGKNVAPQSVEQKLLLSPMIDQAVVLGNRRKFVSALLYLDPVRVMAFAQDRGKTSDYQTLLNDPDLMQFVREEVDQVSRGLAPFEKPKQIRFLPQPLTEEAGDLTPSLKVKLPVVEAKYQSLITAMYANGSLDASAVKPPARTHWMPGTLLAIVVGVLAALLIRYGMG